MFYRCLIFVLTLTLSMIVGCENLGHEQVAAIPRSMDVELQVPNPAWELAIQAVYELNGELWVVAKVARRPGFAPQVITRLKASQTVHTQLVNAPVKVFVVGKTWNWGDEPYQALDSLQQLQQMLREKRRQAVRIFPTDDVSGDTSESTSEPPSFQPGGVNRY